MGRQAGKQDLSLDAGCLGVGTIIHELMHALGFFHEQSRTDRDAYIRVRLENVEAENRDQFEKYGLHAIDDLGESYDFGSILHYRRDTFSANGRDTIEPLVNVSAARAAMGQRRQLSETDVRKINKLYKCGRGGVGGSSSQATQRPTIASTTRPTPGSCVDASSCWYKKLWRHCTDADGVLRRDCPMHCGVCQATNGQSNCVDKFTSCERIRHFCDNDDYRALLTRNCARTCGRCDDSARATTSRDTDEDECKDLESAQTCAFNASMYDCRTSRFLQRRCARTCAPVTNRRCT